MKREVAQVIIRDFPQNALEDYVEDRLKNLYCDFETIKPEDLKGLQGRIQEAKLLLKIREHAQNVLDQARKVKNGEYCEANR